MAIQISIQDPSGETRTFPIRESKDAPATAWTLGNSSGSHFLLKDLTLLPLTATLWKKNPSSQHYWIRTESPNLYGNLAGIGFREMEVPWGIPIILGETKIILRPKNESLLLPHSPPAQRPWKTATNEGANVLWLCQKVARTPLSVYLTGETGTGKDVLAQLIHHWSDRSSGPFIPIHCAALPIGLAESELFGHVKGAFTGASHSRMGALMQAHNGTLFLDEVGDLSLEMQVKLLRFLENGEIRPVGSDKTSSAQVRVICATHKSLPKLIESGQFRRDLFYRLASVTVEIPNLTSRPKDIELLAVDFTRQLGKSLSPEVLPRLLSYEWPGNVRELRHTIERVSGLCGPYREILLESDFDFLKADWAAMMELNHPAGLPVSETNPTSGLLTLEEMERLMLLKALKLATGHRGRAASLLGVARSTLFDMLKRHKIQGPRHAHYLVQPSAA